jgi:hypothetical protein
MKKFALASCVAAHFGAGTVRARSHQEPDDIFVDWRLGASFEAPNFDAALAQLGALADMGIADAVEAVFDMPRIVAHEAGIEAGGDYHIVPTEAGCK